MSSGSKNGMHDRSFFRFSSYGVNSWTEEEYLEAIEDKDFWDSVKDVFDACIPQSAVSLTTDDEPSNVDLMKSKYHFAGGSSRFMFWYPTEEVISEFQEEVDRASDLGAYLGSFAQCDRSNDQVINRLIGRSTTSTGENVSFIISEFATVLCSKKCGRDFVLKYAQNLKSSGNPSVMGWMFEFFFFSNLLVKGVQMVKKGGEEPVNWPSTSKLILFNPSHLPFTRSPPAMKREWYQPKKWNQGGYDAVFIDFELQLVRFVQVASGDTHSFKIEIFHVFLKNLAEFFETKSIEICFVVPRAKIDSFKIDPVTGEGTLAPFGWAKGEEVERCTIIGLDSGWGSIW